MSNYEELYNKYSKDLRIMSKSSRIDYSVFVFLASVIILFFVIYYRK